MHIKITVKCKWNLIVKCKWGLIVYHALVTGILLGNLPQGPLGSANATFNEVQRGLAPTKAIIVSEQMGEAFLPGARSLLYEWQPIQSLSTEDRGFTQERLGFKTGSKELVSLKDCSKQSQDPRLMHYFISLILLFF